MRQCLSNFINASSLTKFMATAQENTRADLGPYKRVTGALESLAMQGARRGLQARSLDTDRNAIGMIVQGRLKQELAACYALAAQSHHTSNRYFKTDTDTHSHHLLPRLPVSFAGRS